MPSNKPFAGVILAGGKSTRMGRNKALLPYGSRLLIDHIKQVLLFAGADSVIISGTLPGYETVPDLVPDKGPVSGIASIMKHCGKNGNKKRLIFTAVDCPKIDKNVFDTLLKESKNDGAVYFLGHPLPCSISVTEKNIKYSENALSLIERQNISVQDFLTFLQADAIPTDSYLEKALTNTNTPDEWLKAIA